MQVCEHFLHVGEYAHANACVRVHSIWLQSRLHASLRTAYLSVREQEEVPEVTPFERHFRN